MLINILIGLSVLLIVFVAVVVMRPSEFRITRTATITAPPSAVFALVNDFHKWMAWSMTGKNNFMFKAVGVFMNMEKMVGGDFEKGLAAMKSTVEAARKA